MEINSQIDLWRGEFGNEYAMRNAATAERVRNQTRFWAKLVDILARRSELPSSILEVGANVGINLRALGNLVDAQFYAVEPNENACATLVRDRVAPAAQVLNTSGEAIALPDASVDMVFTAGVLIHVNPNNLSKVCSRFIGLRARSSCVQSILTHSPKRSSTAVTMTSYSNVISARFGLSSIPR